MQVHLCDRCDKVIYDMPNKWKLYSHDGEVLNHNAVTIIDICDECAIIADSIMHDFMDFNG